MGTCTNPANISPKTWTTFSKYYIGSLEKVVDLIQHQSGFHSSKVDPRELAVSLAFYNLVTSEPAFKQCPTLRHYLVTTQYTKEKHLQSSSGPNVAAFLDPNAITTFAKKPKDVEQVETTLRALTDKYLPILEGGLGQIAARLELTEYMGLLTRCLFGRPWPEHMEIKVTLPLGKFSEEKIKSLGVHCAKVVDLRHPELGFAALAGLEPVVSGEPDPDAMRAVDLSSLSTSRELTGSASGGSEPSVSKFKRVTR